MSLSGPSFFVHSETLLQFYYNYLPSTELWHNIHSVKCHECPKGHFLKTRINKIAFKLGRERMGDYFNWWGGFFLCPLWLQLTNCHLIIYVKKKLMLPTKFLQKHLMTLVDDCCCFLGVCDTLLITFSRVVILFHQLYLICNVFITGRSHIKY